MKTFTFEILFEFNDLIDLKDDKVAKNHPLNFEINIILLIFICAML